MTHSGPKILVVDVEMSFNISYHYDQWGVNIPWTRIKQRQFMICAAWQWIGGKKKYAASVLDDPKRFKKDHTDDYHVIKSLKDQIDTADAVLAFNGKSFDFKEINTGLIKHNLGPTQNYVALDPILIAKSTFRFKGGNSMANISDFLGLSEKSKVEEKDWIAATEGCPEAIKRIIKYNLKDLPPLIDVWEKIKPYAPSKLNMNLFVDPVTQPEVCAHCGGAELESHRVRHFKITGTRYQYKCKDRKCLGFTTFSKAIRTTRMR